MWEILVIDDDEVDREAVRRAFDSLGKNISIRESDSGRDGLSVLEENNVDCVLLDFLLPDMNGLECLKNITTDEGGLLSVPVVMMTGEGSEEVAVAAMKAGAQDYIVKGSHDFSNHVTEAVTRAIERWTLIRDKKLAEHALLLKTHELENARAEADKANHAKSEFLAMVSHDLRTPLNAIMGFSEMMRLEIFGPLGDPRYSGYAGDIYKSGEYLVHLINNILDLSRIEAGKYELTEETLDIAEHLKEAIELMIPLAQEKNIEFHEEIADGTSALRADRRLIRQTVNNLLSNAVKFTMEGGKVHVQAKNEADGSLLVRVIDSGIGMSEDVISRVLEPFEQADSTQPKEHEGSGLGLYICSNLIKLLGGKLYIESKTGQGTIVTLQFPPERSCPQGA